MMTPVDPPDLSRDPGQLQQSQQTIVVGQRFTTCKKTAYAVSGIFILLFAVTMIASGCFVAKPYSNEGGQSSSRKSLALFLIIFGEFTLAVPCLMVCIPLLARCNQFVSLSFPQDSAEWIQMETLEKDSEDPKQDAIPVEEID